jgi:hypothetical protein
VLGIVLARALGVAGVRDPGIDVGIMTRRDYPIVDIKSTDL